MFATPAYAATSDAETTFRGLAWVYHDGNRVEPTGFLGRIYLNGNFVEYLETDWAGDLDFTISVPLEDTPVVELFIMYTNGFANLGPLEFEGELFGDFWLGFLDIHLVGTPTPPADTQAPNINNASNWAHDGINEAFVLGLIPQALQSNYTQATTRAEFSALAVALYEAVTGNEITGRASFNDTNDVNVRKMGYLGVVQGVGGGNFAPNSTITREQAAVMLARLAYAIGQPILASAPTFADNNALSSWAVDGVGQMQASGIMGGVGNNRFDANGEYTREQSIITMLRLFELLG